MSLEQDVKVKAEQTKQIEARIKDLEATGRICQNAFNLINDMEVKGAYAAPVVEIMQWLQGIHTQIQNQIAPLKSLLPKPEEVIVTKHPTQTQPAVEAEVVQELK